jgi:hypothetical protein
MAERSKAAVLKTAERKLRGFESLSLRGIRAVVAVVDMSGGGCRMAAAEPRGEVTERLKVLAC